MRYPSLAKQFEISGNIILDLVGELTNHGNPSADIYQGVVADYIPVYVRVDSAESKLLIKADNISKALLKRQNPHLSFLYENNVYSGEFKIQETSLSSTPWRLDSNLNIRSEIPLSKVVKGGGGKRKRKKSRRKRKKSKMKRKKSKMKRR